MSNSDKKSKPRKLTVKQSRFGEEYCVDFNGTQAAIRAGYSRKTAQQIASENLRKPLIQEFIRIRIDELAKDVGLTPEDVVRGLHSEATFMEKGTKHSARVAAWAWLGRYFELFKDKVDHHHSGEIAITEVEIARPKGEEE